MARAEIIIRRSLPSDVEDINRLAAQRGMVEGPRLTSEHIYRDDIHSLVAEKGGRIVGHILGIERVPAGWGSGKLKRNFVVGFFVTAPDAHVGKQLGRELLKLARDKNYDHVLMTVSKENYGAQNPALAYLRYGAQPKSPSSFKDLREVLAGHRTYTLDIEKGLARLEGKLPLVPVKTVRRRKTD